MLRVVLLIALMLGSAGPTIAEPASFTVMTYNIRAGLGSPTAIRSKRAVASRI